MIYELRSDGADFCCSWGVEAGFKRIEILTDVGHWHCIEAADEVEGLVSGFVEGICVTAGIQKA